MQRNGVSTCKAIGLAAAVAVLSLAAGSRVEGAIDGTGPDPLYMLSYFSNAHVTGAPDGTLRLVNDGALSDHSPDGDLCASIYVFDATEELNECCSCKITPNGLLTLSVNTNLTSNTVTHRTPGRGVIKVISSIPTLSTTTPPGPSVCDPTVVQTNFGIHGWITHIQKAGSTYPQTEEELTDASLNFGPGTESADLAEDCMVAIELGSGQGVCNCIDAGR